MAHGQGHCYICAVYYGMGKSADVSQTFLVSAVLIICPLQLAEGLIGIFLYGICLSSSHTLL